MESTGSSALVLLMIPSRRVFMMNQRLQACFWNCFPWLWFMEPWFTSLQCQWAQFMEQTCPTFYIIICIPFLVPPSCVWQKTEWATFSLINSSLATIPFSFSVQHPLLVCAVLPYQHGSITDTDWTHSQSLTEVDTMKDDVPSEVLFLKPMDFSVT